jgi:hypothetical protein
VESRDEVPLRRSHATSTKKNQGGRPMKEELTPEKVSLIEYRAYNLGVGVGEVQERKRIVELLMHDDTESSRDFHGAHQEDRCLTCINIALIEGDNT